MKKKYFSMLAGGTLSCMVVTVLIILDTVIAGLYIGEKAVTAINLIYPLYSLASFFALFTALGIPITYSAAVGKFDHARAQKLFAFGVVITILTGIIMCILTIALSGVYMEFFGVEPEIDEYARNYLSWMPALFLLLPLQNLISAMVFTDGDESLSVLANVLEAAGNTVFSVLLLQKMGTAGIAAGSVIGIVISISVCLLHFLNKDHNLKLGLYFSKEYFMDLANYGVTDSGVWLFMAVSTGLMNKYVTAYFGMGLLVLVSVFNLMRELQLFFDGIGEAITPILGIYYSEKCYVGVKKIWDLATRTALIEGFVIGALCFALSGQVPGILGISSPIIADYAVMGIRIMSFGLPAASVIFLLTAYYIVIDRIVLSLVVSGLRYTILTLPLALLGGAFFGAEGMFAGIALAPYGALLVIFIYIRIRFGKDAFPLFLDEKEKKVLSFLFEFDLYPEDIARVRDEAENILADCGYERQSVLRAMLLFEEIFMLIYERNPQGNVCAECSIVIKDDIMKLVGRDDGKEIDISDEDMRLESFRSYVLSRLISDRDTAAKHLIAMSYNRNMFEMELQKE